MWGRNPYQNPPRALTPSLPSSIAGRRWWKNIRSVAGRQDSLLSRADRLRDVYISKRERWSNATLKGRVMPLAGQTVHSQESREVDVHGRLVAKWHHSHHSLVGELWLPHQSLEVGLEKPSFGLWLELVTGGVSVCLWHELSIGSHPVRLCCQPLAWTWCWRLPCLPLVWIQLKKQPCRLLAAAWLRRLHHLPLTGTL